ncbi:Uncharacterized protein dnl_23530 [Desulfonema limicola]|uniref:Uncharacterized protein n=1 Tax=Desulfonema limicola TaxID=45656 RepID=A0A975GGA5_9BACT|nr:hypothetical protein [Desulfonema limicola]QTA80067.1 Uncharacterized protein dnl_23530 [Desulfonema limicola]
MNSINIKEMSEALDSIDIKPFISQVKQYIRISKYIDQTLRTPDFLISGQKKYRKKNEQYDLCCENIGKTALEILSKSTLSANRIINFGISINLQGNTIPEINAQTEYYFRRIKKQQMELLSAIGDDIEIIKNMICQAKEMRSVMKTHAPAINKTNGLMEVMRERIAERPTTLLRLEGTGDKIRELNKTLKNMQEYENVNGSRINRDAQNNPVGKAFSAYYDLVQISCTDIDYLKLRIQKRFKELKQGGKLMLKLSAKGYSPFQKRKLDMLLSCHDERTQEFQKNIHECRKLYFNDTENIPIIHHPDIFTSIRPAPGFGLH